MPSTTKINKDIITPQGQEAKNRIAQVRQKVDSGISTAEARKSVRQMPIITPVTPAPTPESSVITADSLSSAPTPIKLSEPTPATQSTGMMEEFADSTDTYTTNLQNQANALEAPKANALTAYIEQLTGAKGVSGLTADAYAMEGGVDQIAPELNDINDKIRREQLSMRRRVEEITNIGGQSKAQAQAMINNIERESFAKQADLSIIQQAVQGRYDSAKEIADRAVSAMLEKQTNDLAILKFNYEENKDLFTKAEQRAFESAQTDRENKLAQERENKTAIYDLGIQASADGAPSSVIERMMKAKTREDALAIGGSYIGALDRQIKEASLKEKYKEAKPPIVTLSPEKKQSLITVGFTAEEIDSIESDVSEFGLQSVLDGLDTEEEKKAVKAIYDKSASKENDVFLNEEYFKSLFGTEELQKVAKEAGKVTGGDDYIPFNESGDVDAYLKQLMATVELYRQAGYSDKEILNKMQ